MSRETFVWDRENLQLVPRDEYYARKYAHVSQAHMVMSDIGEYRSVIDKSIIGGRRQHREHLRAHGCVEVGNECIPPRRSELSQAERFRDIKRSMGE